MRARRTKKKVQPEECCLLETCSLRDRPDSPRSVCHANFQAPKSPGPRSFRHQDLIQQDASADFVSRQAVCCFSPEGAPNSGERSVPHNSMSTPQPAHCLSVFQRSLGSPPPLPTHKFVVCRELDRGTAAAPEGESLKECPTATRPVSPSGYACPARP